MIGVDKEALDAQVAEMKDRKEQQRLADQRSFHGMNQIDKQLKIIESEKQKARRDQEIACKEFSLQHLHAEARETFDINDPLAKRKGIPARVGDDDTRCGPSSMQRFSGEDLMKDERVRQQRAAMVSTIEQQKFEKAILAKRVNDGGFGVQVEEITAL